MKFAKKLLRLTLIGGLAMFILGCLTVGGLYLYLAPSLPSVAVLRDVRFQVPLQVYTLDQQLIAEYGTHKREPLTYDQIPTSLVHAILAIEDENFFNHVGIDPKGVLRAAANAISTGQMSQGASTITMQLARNVFLSPERKMLRKIKEAFLAIKIELELEKEEILELYFNIIFLGNRAYGFGSAAQVYYGKPLDELNIAQLAMLAGLPKAPSANNPIANPDRALVRRNYILQRMAELNYISAADRDWAQKQPITAKVHSAAIDLEAPFVGEMVRQHMVAQYGEEAYNTGFKVYVTINPDMQMAAQRALRHGIDDYERRHGYTGPVDRIAMSADTTTESLLTKLKPLPTVGELLPAVVLKTAEQTATVLGQNGHQYRIDWDGMSWAARRQTNNRKGPAPETAANIFKLGDIIHILPNTEAPGTATLAQIPQVSGAIVAMQPRDGALLALAGGYDFFHSKFNRATQAKRQAGSSFKPFTYSAALEHGFTTASIINDAPVVFDDPSLESSWRPENYSGQFYGPTRLRLALTQSRNLVSIRLLQSIGIRTTIDYLENFGFDSSQLPRDLSLSLGSASLTPWENASAYTVFANGGFKVEPYFIQRIEDIRGNVLFEADPLIACTECEQTQDAPPVIETPIADNCQHLDATQTFATTISDCLEPSTEAQPRLAPRAIPAQNAYLITSMLRDVITDGTGRRALSLGRNDLAGKTGTTNDQRDAWFAGYNSNIVAISWAGFDDSSPLGDQETGSRAALPMWVEFMETALAGTEETSLTQPPGLVTVRIDPDSGLLAGADQRNAIFETFRAEHAPTRRATDVDDSISSGNNNTKTEQDDTPQLLF